MNPRLGLLAAATALALTACGGGGGGGGANAGGAGSAQALAAEIDQRYPFVADQPLDVTFVCGRSNSQLTYYFDFDLNGSFTVFFETNTFQQVSFSGTYTVGSGAIRMLALNNPVLPLDETTTQIVPMLGLVGAFETPIMRCTAVAHGYNDPATETFKSFDCPLINRGATSDEDNSIEFSDASSPFAYQFRGGIFRQRDINVVGLANPIVTRGYGIFRRTGDTFYADFGNQFPDHRWLKGRFSDSDRQLTVDQLEPAAGNCRRR